MTDDEAPDPSTRRLDLAATRAFATPGAGAARRAAIDAFNVDWLQGVWSRATDGRAVEGVALAAVGSTGRGDAGPLSDYDLVLVHADRGPQERDVTALADALFYPLWDAGVRLDHSVRSASQCRQVAAEDLAVAVGLLDLRAVAGDADLVRAVRESVGTHWRGTARKRLPEIAEAVTARHRRQGDLAQSIEPDLKEARGGFRDMTILRALTQAWLSDRPHGGVDAAYARLLDVRDALHVVTGRGRDRLGREDHDAVAVLLGLDGADDLLTDVSLAARTIAHALDGTLRRAGQTQRARVLRVGPRRPQLVPLGHGISLSDGEVVLSTPALAVDPLMPLRVAVVAARAGHPVAPATLDNLATRAGTLPTPWPVEARDLFGELLAAGPGLLPVWESLDQAGIVDRWLPEWAAVRSRPQRSPVHRHTVDRHLLECVVRAQGLVRGVARPDLLLLAALLHDIGKVRGARDHSREGAPVAGIVMARLGYPAQDVDVVVRLVREHLTLIDLATRRDHADPATVEAALAAVDGSASTLDLLLALTEADAAATGPKAWTDWRASLLRALATSTRAFLAGRGTLAAEREDVGASVVVPVLVDGRPRVDVVPLGASFRVDVAAVDRLGLFADTAGLLAVEGCVVRTAILRTLEGVAVDEWYVEVTSTTPPDAGRLVRALDRLAAGDRTPLAALDRRRPVAPRPTGTVAVGAAGQSRAFVVPGASEDATVIEVRTADRRGLLHDLGRALAAAGVSVRSAHISTYAGQTLDTFYLTDPAGERLEPGEVGHLLTLVLDACDGVGPGR